MKYHSDIEMHENDIILNNKSLKETIEKLNKKIDDLESKIDKLEFDKIVKSYKIIKKDLKNNTAELVNEKGTIVVLDMGNDCRTISDGCIYNQLHNTIKNNR